MMGHNKTDDYFVRMVNDVQERKYDIALSPFHYMTKRFEIVDYTYLIHEDK